MCAIFFFFFKIVVVNKLQMSASNPPMSQPLINDAVLAGVPRLLDDFQKLLETHDHADILFLVGREEATFYAHRLILNAR